MVQDISLASVSLLAITLVQVTTAALTEVRLALVVHIKRKEQRTNVIK